MISKRNQKPGVRKAPESKPAGGKEAERLSAEVGILESQSGRPGRLSAPELVENTTLADQLFKDRSPGH
jgi:hypothetical protein